MDSCVQVIHHFFLTRYGVYCVVFNMECLIHDDEETRTRCLDTLKFWVNSIVVHTFNPQTTETAPIAFVGTRKDVVSNPAHHERISAVLYDNFSMSSAWPSVIKNENGIGENDKTEFCFFPVDNTKSRADPQVTHLLQDIERVIDNSDYVHQEQPLVYLQTIDKLVSLAKPCFSYEEVSRVAQMCGVDKDGVTAMLKLFHDMGTVMFHGIATVFVFMHGASVRVYM